MRHYTITFANAKDLAVIKTQAESAKAAINNANDILREAKMKLLKITNR